MDFARNPACREFWRIPLQSAASATSCLELLKPVFIVPRGLPWSEFKGNLRHTRLNLRCWLVENVATHGGLNGLCGFLGEMTRTSNAADINGLDPLAEEPGISVTHGASILEEHHSHVLAILAGIVHSVTAFFGRSEGLLGVSEKAVVDVDVVDGVVRVRLTGACGGCPMSQMTIKNGIERLLKQEIPEVKSVVSV